MNKTKHQPKEISGSVVSVGMNKTVIVTVGRLWRHPIYKKAIRRSHRIAAHVEGLELKIGDAVRIVETKPISKTKHFRVVGKL